MNEPTTDAPAPKAEEDIILEGSALAQAMLEWESRRRELDALEEVISRSVLAMGESYVVGNVRATYSKGRITWHYEDAAKNHPMVNEATINLYTKQVVDWREVCKHVGIEGTDIPFTQASPSVTLKLK